jgi:chaperonin GroEL
MSKKKTGVIFQPHLGEGMRRGINQVVSAVSPTLGLSGRTVLHSSSNHTQILDNGKDIAQRITALRGKAENAGAMLVREVMQRQHAATGDGSTTAAVLFQKVYELGYQYLASGGDVQKLRHTLNTYLPLLIQELERLSQKLEGKEQLIGFAKAHCQDEAVATALGEIMDVVGPFGRVDVRTHYQNTLHYEFVNGSYWISEPFSRDMLWNNRTSATLSNPAIFLSDLELNQTRDLLPLFTAATERACPSLMIVARGFSKEATAAMYSLMQSSNVRCVAVKLPGATLTTQMAVLEDLAVLTGGRPYHQAAGSSTKHLAPKHLGQVRRATIRLNHFLLAGFKGDVVPKKEYLSRLKNQFLRAEDAKTRQSVQERIATFVGGSATVWLPDHTKSETEFKKNLTQRLISVLRHALLTGVVPGGGAGLFACSCLLEKKLSSLHDDERAALRILIRALQEPARVLLRNASCDVASALRALAQSSEGYGYDARSGQVVNLINAGILDGLEVQKTALQISVRTAALALTTAAFVY